MGNLPPTVRCYCQREMSVRQAVQNYTTACNKTVLGLAVCTICSVTWDLVEIRRSSTMRLWHSLSGGRLFPVFEQQMQRGQDFAVK